MRRVETVFIAAGTERVWPFVADPVLHAEWNPKVVSIGRVRNGPALAGERFEMSYRMGERDRVSRVHVLRAMPPTEITFGHNARRTHGNVVAEEAYTLAPEPGGTRLTQTLMIDGLPWWVDLLMRVIGRVGTPMGAAPLATLKARVEREA